VRTQIIITSLWLLSQSAIADRDAERHALAQLVHELDALQPVIEHAQHNADHDAHIRFHYDWLRADINHIRSGIQNHLIQPRQQPRTIPPLKGDYRQ
jgi:RAQPRD family integrative conjugative element protein